MRLSRTNKFKHFVWSVISCKVGIFVSVALLASVSVVLFFVPFIWSSQIVSFLTGIISGIIAALFLKISDKYIASLDAYNLILVHLDVLCEYVKNNVLSMPVPSNFMKHRFLIWELNQRILVDSLKLTYKKDLDFLLPHVQDVVEDIYNNAALNQIQNDLDDLMKYRNEQ